MARAVIVVDMQNDFVTGVLGTAEAREMLPRLVKKLEDIIAEDSADLFFTQDTHKADYLNTQEGKNLPVVHCIKGSDGWEIVPELKPFTKHAKMIIEKKSFGTTRLPTLLKPYSTVEFVGVCTDICVVSNALLVKAFYPETAIVIDAGCCAGVTPEGHRHAIETMRACQCKIKE